MKKMIPTLPAIFFALILNTLQAQTPEEFLTKAYAQFEAAKNEGDMITVSAQFDQAVAKWPNEWAANYYAAYAKAIISYLEPVKEKKDLFLDQADPLVEKVKALNDKSDETYVLAALVANARLSVDGATRWKKYGDVFSDDLKKAKAINADNPHIYYLKGVSVFYTPAAFGGGKKNAKTYLEKSKDLFAKQDSGSVMKPYWGLKPCEDYLQKCEEK